VRLDFEEGEAGNVHDGVLGKSFIGRDANNLLAQIATWQQADISDNARFHGNLAAALDAIRARTIVMPSRTDLYFVPEDSAREVALMPNAELRVIESVWGHRAATHGTDPTDMEFLGRAIRDVLDGPGGR
jgi:homoserine O-acetyltransferase